MSEGGVKISLLPKLVIKIFGYSVEDVYELEEAKYILNFAERTIVVDGQEAHSYDELVRMVSQEKYKNKEFIEVVLIPPIAGG